MPEWVQVYLGVSVVFMFMGAFVVVVLRDSDDDSFRKLAAASLLFGWTWPLALIAGLGYLFYFAFRILWPKKTAKEN